MMIGWIVIIPLVLIGIWYVNQYQIDDSATKEEKPLGILKKRFAAGEITRQEYEEEKTVFEK